MFEQTTDSANLTTTPLLGQVMINIPTHGQIVAVYEMENRRGSLTNGSTGVRAVEIVEAAVETTFLREKESGKRNERGNGREKENPVGRKLNDKPRIWTSHQGTLRQLLNL